MSLFTRRRQNTTVILNACGTSGDVSQKLADFLKYMTGSKPKDGFAKQVHNAVENAIASKEWRAEFMTLQTMIMEERAEARAECQKRTAINLKKSGMSDEHIAQVVEVDVDLVRLWVKQLEL